MPDYLSTFQKLVAKNENVRFMNVYKGVPISYYGKAVESGTNSVRFSVHANQILCMREEGTTYLYCVTVGKVVKATLLGVDILKETILLSNFESANHTIGSRSYIRVQPKELVEITITNEALNLPDMSLKAGLVDISLRGAGIFLSLSGPTLNYLKRGESVLLNFSLPDEGHGMSAFSINGLIKNLTQVSRIKFTSRIGIQTYPDKQAEQGLSQYIAQRQNDILKEIKEKVQQELRFK